MPTPTTSSASSRKNFALRIRHLGSIGAYIAGRRQHRTVNLAPARHSHDIADDIAARCVFAAPPTAPYRGAGRPEANYIPSA